MALHAACEFDEPPRQAHFLASTPFIMLSVTRRPEMTAARKSIFCQSELVLPTRMILASFTVGDGFMFELSKARV
jgi:hypothetical protein